MSSTLLSKKNILDNLISDGYRTLKSGEITYPDCFRAILYFSGTLIPVGIKFREFDPNALGNMHLVQGNCNVSTAVAVITKTWNEIYTLVLGSANTNGDYEFSFSDFQEIQAQCKALGLISQIPQ